MATARTNPLLQGSQINLSVEKGGQFVVVGCAEDITFKSTITGEEYSCRSGSGKTPSGDDPSWSITVKGLMMYYTGAQIAGNVGVLDLADFHTNKTVINVKVFSDFIGDAVWTGPVFVADMDLSAPQKGNAGYTFQLEGAGKYTRSTVAA